MLVLTRRRHQRIIIGDDIVLTVVEFRLSDGEAPRVRIGIEAPRNVSVHREEVWLDIQAGKKREPEKKDGGPST